MLPPEHLHVGLPEKVRKASKETYDFLWLLKSQQIISTDVEGFMLKWHTEEGLPYK